MGSQATATRGKIIQLRTKDVLAGRKRQITQFDLARYCDERQKLHDLMEEIQPQMDKVARMRRKLKGLMRRRVEVEDGMWRIELKKQNRKASSFDVVRVSV